MKRNQQSDGTYSSVRAEAKYHTRRKGCHRQHLLANSELRDWVNGKFSIINGLLSKLINGLNEIIGLGKSVIRPSIVELSVIFWMNPIVNPVNAGLPVTSLAIGKLIRSLERSDPNVW
jgi:hypothetical protein